MPISLNLGYIFQITGLLKISQLVLSIICMICIGVAGYGQAYPSETNFCWFTYSVALICSIILLLLYLFSIPTALTQIPWGFIEAGISCFFLLFYFIAMCICAHLSSVTSDTYVTRVKTYSNGYAAAAFFSIFAAVLHGVNIFIHIRIWRTQAARPNPNSPAYVDTPSGAPGY